MSATIYTWQEAMFGASKAKIGASNSKQELGFFFKYSFRKA